MVFSVYPPCLKYALPGLTPVPAVGVPPVPPLAPVRSLSPSGPPSPSPSPGVSPLGTPRYKSVVSSFFFKAIANVWLLILLIYHLYWCTWGSERPSSR